MDTETLRKVQLVQLDIAKELKRVCSELGITFFLDSGTLLGAVRHKGFIPWDDDLDIGMMRDDYEQFLAKAPKVLKDNFFLQTWYSDQSYGLAFAKLRLRNTRYIEAAAQYSDAENGIYIDIFPYDEYPLTKKEQNWHHMRHEVYKRCLLVKSGYSPWENENGIRRYAKKAAYIGIEVVASLYSRDQLIKSYYNLCTKFNGSGTGFYFEKAGALRYGNSVIPASCFSEYVNMEFEGELFPCPKDYDLYLKSAYGDYMKLPPEDKRENRHNILEIKFADE